MTRTPVPLALALGLLLGGSTAAAQEPRPIPLTEAIGTALQRNPTLGAERVDVDIAAANQRQARGVDDPWFEAGIDGAVQRTNPVDGPFFQQLELDLLAARAGFFYPLAGGGRLGLELDHDLVRTLTRIDQGMGGLDLDTTIHTPRLRASLLQPLLAGRGAAVHRAPLRRAAIARSVEELERERAAADLVRDVVRAYWELAYAGREVDIRRSGLVLAQRQREITAAAVTAQAKPQIELLAADQTIALREEAVVVAEQLLAERALELRLLLNLESGPPLAAGDALDIAGTRAALDGATARAWQFSPELRALAQQDRLARVDTEVAENDMRPRLDLAVSGGPAGNSDGFADAYSAAARADSWDVRGGLVLRVPLGNHAAAGRRDAARLRSRRIALQKETVKGQIAAAVERAAGRVRTAEARLQAAGRAVTLARRTGELERGRWQVGDATNFDVARRDDELAAAELVEARARTDYLAAIAVLESLTGDLLARHGITVR